MACHGPTVQVTRLILEDQGLHRSPHMAGVERLSHAIFRLPLPRLVLFLPILAMSPAHFRDF